MTIRYLLKVSKIISSFSLSSLSLSLSLSLISSSSARDIEYTDCISAEG